jgi:hypothetical protein
MCGSSIILINNNLQMKQSYLFYNNKIQVPSKIYIYYLFIAYLWCITNVSSVFTEIIFDEASHTGSAPTISDVISESIFINYNW